MRLVVTLTCSCLLTTPPLSFAQAAAPAPPRAAASGNTTAPSLEDISLPSAPTPNPAQNQTAPPNEPQVPANDQQNRKPPASGNSLSLQGLGFTPSQTAPNAALQARLNKRTHMLKIHQRLGLLTTIPLVATVFASGGAKQKHSGGPGSSTVIEPSSANVDLHAALGSLTVGMYAATAYYAIAAPKIPGVKPTGAIRLHRDLAWIHGPGMILTPILGAMALSQEDKGEKVHGIASAHAYVAATTVIAYGAAIVAVSWPIHLKFWR